MKMRNKIFWLCILLSTFNVYSIEVEHAGELRNVVTDKSVTELTVQGEIDVRDLKFIVEELSNLECLDLSGAEIVAYKSSVPYFSDVLEYPANELPDYCFFDKNYKSVVLPSSLSYIGEAAFAGCDNLTKVVCPENLDSIGNYAFSSCDGLEGVTFNAGIEKIGIGAFAKCAKLKSLDLSVIGSTCNFGKGVFAGCISLESVNMGDQITDIAANMFAGCTMLKTINLGTNPTLKSIGEDAFASTGLTAFDFSVCTQLKVIGRWAFAGVQLAEIVLPASIESIGEGAFFYNESLKDVAVPASVTKVEGYTFNGNTSLATISLPATLVYVGTRAFEDNTGMTNITIEAENVPELGENVFAGVDQPNVELKVPNESVLMYKWAEQWQEFNIIGDISTIEDFIVEENAIKVSFEDKILNVISNNEILQVMVYEPNGVCLVSAKPLSESVQIDMSTMGGHVYVVYVKLKNGKEKTFKLVR